MNASASAVIITYVVLGLIVQVLFSFLVSYVAGQKGRSRSGFFWLSFFTSFFIGLIVVAIIPARHAGESRYSHVAPAESNRPLQTGQRSNARPTVYCPFCAEEILAAASVCKHCGRDVEPRSFAVETMREAPATGNSLSGLIFKNITVGGPAEFAGIQVGDLMTSFNGRPIKTAVDLARALEEAKPGSNAVVEVFRNGSYRTLTVGLSLFA